MDLEHEERLEAVQACAAKRLAQTAVTANRTNAIATALATAGAIIQGSQSIPSSEGIPPAETPRNDQLQITHQPFSDSYVQKLEETFTTSASEARTQDLRIKELEGNLLESQLSVSALHGKLKTEFTGLSKLPTEEIDSRAKQLIADSGWHPADGHMGRSIISSTSSTISRSASDFGTPSTTHYVAERATHSPPPPDSQRP